MSNPSVSEEQKRALEILGQLSGCGSTDEDIDVVVQALRQSAENAAMAVLKPVEEKYDKLWEECERVRDESCDLNTCPFELRNEERRSYVDAARSAASPFLKNRGE